MDVEFLKSQLNEAGLPYGAKDKQISCLKLLLEGTKFAISE